MRKSLNEWAAEIHQNAVDHGWWDEPRSFGDIVALCHSELSEALEEYRNGKPMIYHYCGKSGQICEGESCRGFAYRTEKLEECRLYNQKPEGVAVEMIDCLIRILDWCGKEGVDVDAILQDKHEYNKTRPYRHGGKAL